MDFTPNPEQQAVADVVTSVLERDNTWDALVSGGVAALGVRNASAVTVWVCPNFPPP
ncbi:acyl-CoA dehydrogenase FadE28 [Mycolicibacterium fortuitum]|uniref:Acyl-CoA dehydrogenase FadE28 n=1 Tax=Mycolicibacterium fortuitum TaxID=1766 RepID=A0A378UWI1_MYCFO|nr:acyl-CoA dehydrogenase FadE28 [Mycolicibacterium fortuitum]